MIDLYTLTSKEVSRFMRVWKQTILPPIVTIVLYLLIFWKFIWDKIDLGTWVSYIEFIFPGLLMMSVIMASYQNTSSSFFGSKFQHNIEELFVAPVAHWKILTGFCFWAVLRGIMVWICVLIAGTFMVEIQIHSYFYFATFILLSSTLFALLWLLNGIYAKSFDDISIIPSFIITPLIYLGWVFYTTDLLSPFWQNLSLANPILYMVNGLRYAFIGISDVDVFVAISMLVAFIIALVITNLWLLKKWYGIRN